MLDVLDTLVKAYVAMGQGDLATLYTYFSHDIVMVMAGDAQWSVTGTYTGLAACKDFFEKKLIPARLAANITYQPLVRNITLLSKCKLAVQLEVTTGFGVVWEEHVFSFLENKIVFAKFSSLGVDDQQVLARIYAP